MPDAIHFPAGSAVVGCVVVKARSGGMVRQVVLKCPCGNEFTVRHSSVLRVRLAGGFMECPECRKKPNVKRPQQVPQSPRIATALAMLKEGRRQIEIADATGLATRTVYQVWLRWIVLPERDALKAEVERLRQSIQHQESRP